MNSIDPTRDRIEAAERMLHHARQQHAHGNSEDATEFLAAAKRNIDRALKSLESPTAVVSLPRGKETAHAR